MEPVRDMMATSLKMSDEQWSQVQMAEALARQRDGQPLMRKFRATVAATNELEDRCLTLVGLLLREHALWAGIPTISLTVHQRAKAFKMLSRMGCAVEELLRWEHVKMPLALFRLLADTSPAAVASLKAIPGCRRDSWSDHFLTTYDDPTCPEAIAVLTAIAAQLKVDVSEIERGHASIRRLLVARNNLSHTMTFPELSGLWMAHQVRRKGMVSRYGALGRKRPSASAPAKKKASQKPKQKKGGGGGWRAYMSAQLRQRGRGLNMRHDGVVAMLSREYRELAAEDKAAYIALGQRATRRWKEQSGRARTSLGLARRKRDFVGKLKRQERAAFWKRLGDKPEQERLDMLVDTSTAVDNTGEAFLNTLAKCRSLAREEGDSKRQRLADLDSSLQEWRAGEGSEIVQQIVDALALQPNRAEIVKQQLLAEPADGCDIVRFYPNVGEAAANLTALLHEDTSFSELRVAMEEDRL